jgi:diguanylate cyclase (GGDEF)-like protein/PAS domain S-box-containing protein
MFGNEIVNILLVDDRPENLLALEAIIERSDYHLIKASSGEEALIQLLKYEVAVILMDVQMPGVDGFETAKIIKARERTKNIPIIFITANNLDSKHIFLGYSVGAIDYILKPFDPFVLKSKIEIFVEMYRINQKYIRQAEILIEKTKELANINQELTNKSNDLLESEALANVIGETTIDSMIIMDYQGLILKVNPAFHKTFFYTKDEIVGRNITLLFPDDKSKEFVKNMLGAIHTVDDTNLNEVLACRKDGDWFYAEIQIGKRYVKNKSIVACTLRDITKRKHAQELITHMAYHDGLTNLPNRRKFNERLHVEIKKAKENNTPLSIIYVDMDRFKFINDSLGHFIGDKLLQEFSNRMVEMVGDEGFVARLGGDEFTVLLPNTNRENAIELAETILEGMKRPFYIDKYELFSTASMGVSIFPYDGDDPLVLMKNADAALYRAKEQGKNTYKIFHSGLNIHSYKAFVLQNELRKAIERNELTLYFQPKLEHESGRINSAEVLLRWNHPDWGVILPSEFIPLAEETGQMVEIGDWVLKSACEQIKRWSDSKMASIKLSLNFSPRFFLQKDLMEKLGNILNETGISASMLEIEISESTLIENEERIIRVLHELRSIGVSISIDDFGKGYSSLSYLRRLPVQSLKLDRSFIQDLSISRPESISLISSILSLGQSLDMSVVAKGVETEEQLNILIKNHCKEFQGYFICPPVPIQELEQFLVNRSNQSKTHESKAESSPSKEVYLERNNGQLEHKQEILNTALARTRDLYSISAREIEVFTLLVEGLSNKDISETLFISEHTVKNHITRIFQKLQVSDRVQAMGILYQMCIEESQKVVFQ